MTKINRINETLINLFTDYKVRYVTTLVSSHKTTIKVDNEIIEISVRLNEDRKLYYWTLS